VEYFSTFCPFCDPEIGFKCHNEQKSISWSKVCNGILDCSDGSDAISLVCNCLPFLTNRFVCPSEPERCVDQNKTCDGFADCPNGEDEQNCTSCLNNPNGFYCPLKSKCFNSFSRCDGIVDCPDYLDEDNCTCTACKSQFGYQTFMCQIGQRCLHQNFVCNSGNEINCPGPNPTEDEQKCSYQQNISPIRNLVPS